MLTKGIVICQNGVGVGHVTSRL